MAKRKNSRKGHTHFVCRTPDGAYTLFEKENRSWIAIEKTHQVIKTGTFDDCVDFSLRKVNEALELCRWNLRMIRQQEKIISTKG